MKRVLVCTPTWNKAHFLRATLYSLQATADEEMYRHIVVDNGSTDDTRRACQEYRVERIYNPDNMGIAAALNQGLARLEPGQCFMKLDDDVTFFEGGWLRGMLGVLVEHGDVGGVALPRLGREAEQLSGIREGSKTEDGLIDAGELWWTNCALYRYEAVTALGSFWQPGLYGYEDVLTGVRLRKLGWRTVYLAGQRIRHEGCWKIGRESREYQAWKGKQRIGGREIKGIIQDFETGRRAAHIPLEVEHGVGAV